MFAELTEAEDTEMAWQEKTVKRVGETTLDRVHQAMILFAAGRGEALKRFVVEDGVGRMASSGDWRRHSLRSIPPGTDERRWVEGRTGAQEAVRILMISRSARRCKGMALKPWYKVVTPREDLRDGKPLDACEFAVHLDRCGTGARPRSIRSRNDSLKRTFLTKGLTGVAAEVLRRLVGEKTETSAVFNMTTQFGGGKTHALTLLYHLANNGPKAKEWQGVSRLAAGGGHQRGARKPESPCLSGRSSIRLPAAAASTERRYERRPGARLRSSLAAKAPCRFWRSTRSRAWRRAAT